MLKQNSSNPIYTIIVSLLYVAGGIAIILIPEISMKVFVQFLGCLLLITGITSLISSMSTMQVSPSFLIVPGGITSMIAGAIFLFFPAFIAGFMLFILSFILIITGISILGIQIRAGFKSGISWVIGFFSLLALIAGIFMITNPIGSEISIMKLIGGLIILYGFFKLISIFRIRKKLKQTPHEPEIIDAEYEEVE
ncbi:MAG: DUF308 domain-containing protein [Prolixibacteraceae bacterium]|nr:DUF308 domain-containing protein [Prolixibacteraceae bacterium]